MSARSYTESVRIADAEQQVIFLLCLRVWSLNLQESREGPWGRCL